MKRKRGNLWMAVDTTLVELPLAVGDTAEELAGYMNTTAHNIVVRYSRGDTGKRAGYRIVKIKAESGECNEPRAIQGAAIQI